MTKRTAKRTFSAIPASTWAQIVKAAEARGRTVISKELGLTPTWYSNHLARFGVDVAPRVRPSTLKKVLAWDAKLSHVAGGNGLAKVAEAPSRPVSSYAELLTALTTMG